MEREGRNEVEQKGLIKEDLGVTNKRLTKVKYSSLGASATVSPSKVSPTVPSGA